jgi:AraC-like DNA-binding protein
MSTLIRIAHLNAPFVYRTMQEIEENRQKSTSSELPHRHDYFTIIAVERAQGTHQIDFTNHPLAPNTIFFISPEQVHNLSIVPHTEHELRGHVLLFTTDFLLEYSISPKRLTELELFFNCDESRPLSVSESEMQQLNFYFQKIATEFSQENPHKLEVLGAWLKLLTMEFVRLKQDKNLKNSKLDHRQAEIVRHFKNDVEQKFSTWHQVAEYAQAQNLSSNYLNEIIKSETGTSAKEFILNRLILEAKRLARYSEMTAKEIAFALGYEDGAQFSKFFKKQTGMTLSEFKKQVIATNP